MISVDIDLDPGKSVIAKLVSSRGTSRGTDKYRVRYRVSLDGQTIVYLPKESSKKNTFIYDTNMLLPDDKRYIYATQVIEVDFYSGGTITVEDQATKEVLHTKKVSKKIA